MEMSQLKALSDGTRLKIVMTLYPRTYCGKALAWKLGVSESSISQHLKVLRDCGLVEGVKYGYYTHYMLNREALAALGEALTALSRLPDEKVECEMKMTVGCKNR
ncbi:MAG: winged helix-turn-helix transcriptional regulator [Clostridia bacterium]|nr:winged helix-turn-helix transcriptional regulator [Clostridia bacterium]